VFIAVWLLINVVLTVSVYVYGRTDRAETADVIVVLGSGLRRDNRPGPALVRRSTQAAELYAQGFASHVICTGGYTVGRERSEADGCREVLEANGVPASAISLEARSRSTEENALYTQEIMTANGWETALLVSDGYHLLRAQWIFSDEGIAVSTSPASDPTRFSHVIATLREVVALNWQAFKTVFNLPFTYVPVI
jgi:uncharacterized SAM-binding protein YcdF (DUF218 family)